MIQDFFELETDPFSLSPDLDFLFLSAAHEEAVAHLAYGLEQDEDIILISGDIGTGKTLALHFLLKQVSKAFLPVFINVTTLEFFDFLRLVLRRLGEDLRPDAPLSDLIYTFELLLERSRRQGKKVLLIIDEAQNLSPATLESIRLLLNLAQPGSQALQLILVGQLGLKANLARPELRQLKQRIRVEYQLGFLSQTEMDSYIRHRLEKAGCDHQLFQRDALEKIFRFSAGVPRLVNHLANSGLLAAFVEGKHKVSARHIEEIDTGEPVAPVAPVAPVTPVTPVAPVPPVAPIAPAAVETPPPPPVPQPVAEAPNAFATRRQRTLHPLAVIIPIVLLVVAAGYFTYPSWQHLLKNLTSTTRPVQVAQVEPEPVLPTETVKAPVKTVRDTVAQATAATVQVTKKEAIEVPRETKTTTVATAPTSGEPHYMVHVASFRDPGRSTSFQSRLSRLGIASTVEEADKNNSHWYRVLLGPFPSDEAARNTTDALRESGTISYYNILPRDAS